MLATVAHRRRHRRLSLLITTIIIITRYFSFVCPGSCDRNRFRNRMKFENMIRHRCHTVVAIAANRKRKMVNRYYEIRSFRSYIVIRRIVGAVVVEMRVERGRPIVDSYTIHCCRCSIPFIEIRVEISTAPRAASSSGCRRGYAQTIN